MLESPSRDSFRFAPTQPASDEIARIGCSQLDLTIGLLAQSSNGSDEDGEAVHEARKALKRLRALLRVGRGVIGDERCREANLILRDAGRALSGTRDAQVLLETLDALTARYQDALQDRTWSALRSSLADAARQSGAVEPEQAAMLTGVLSATRAQIGGWRHSRVGGPESLADGFGRVYRRGRRAYRAAQANPGPELLHELRKRAKDLWHGAQLLRGAAPDQMKELARSAHGLSDLLGHDHDLAILSEHARACPELLSSVELDLLLALIGSRQQALRGEAIECASELYRAKPKQLLARVALA